MGASRHAHRQRQYASSNNQTRFFPDWLLAETGFYLHCTVVDFGTGFGCVCTGFPAEIYGYFSKWLGEYRGATPAWG